PVRPRHRNAEVPRCPGRDDPGPARRPPWCDESPHPGRGAARRPSRDRARTRPGAAAQPHVQAADPRLRCPAPRPGGRDPASPVKPALGARARRWQALQAEIDDLDTQLTPLVTAVTPELLALPGVGVETAGQLLVTAGDNRDRLRSEASFARLCGTAPIPVSSGRT